MAVRYWASRYSTVPRIVADETAYLSMARFLAGGEVWNLGRAATYGPGYSLLLAPFFRMGLDADQIFRMAIYLNVVLGGLLVCAWHALARRLTNLSWTWCVAAATIAACLPTLVAMANYAWSDNLAPLAFAILLLALLRYLEAPTIGRSFLFVASQVFAYATHGRFAPLAVVTFVVIIIVAWQRRSRPIVAGSTVALLVAGMVAVSRGSQAMYERLYQEGGALTQTTANLDRALQVQPLLISAAGQSWYLLVTTAGLAGFGALALARESGSQVVDLVRRRPEATSATSVESVSCGGLRPIAPLALGAIIAMLALSFMVSVGFMTDRPRPDHLVYGRYNDAIVGLLVIVGLSALAATTPIRRRLADAAFVVAAMVATGTVIFKTRFDLLTQRFTRVTIEGLIAIEPLGTQRIRVATAIGVAITFSLVLASLLRRHRKVALFTVAALLVVVGAQRVEERYAKASNPHPETVAALSAFLGSDDIIWFTTEGPANVKGFYLYPFYEPPLDLRMGRGPATFEDGHTFVMGSADEPEAVDAGYRLLWVDPSFRNALWVGPGERQDELAAAGQLLAPTGL